MATTRNHHAIRFPFLSILIMFLALATYPSPTLSAKCHKDDKKALLAIKQFWGNPSVLSSWDPSTGCCGWSGISCDQDTDRVYQLFIGFDTDLVGTIPPAIGDLPFLTSIFFRFLPNLTGPIIPDLARLTRLETLKLDYNGLSGSLPPSLASIKTLSTIDLTSNRISGSIPPELFSLPNIYDLSLGSNRLTGSIPDAFTNFPSKTILSLENNMLTGSLPASIAGIDFYVLNISTNRLSGDASLLFRPSSVPLDQTIDISLNDFEFDLTNVKFPLNLTYLDISHNRIYGSIPQQITKLRALSHLDVSYNRLCGRIPTGINKFSQWVYEHNLCLCGSPLPPCMPKWDSGLRQIQVGFALPA